MQNDVEDFERLPESNKKDSTMMNRTRTQLSHKSLALFLWVTPNPFALLMKQFLWLVNVVGTIVIFTPARGYSSWATFTLIDRD